MSDEQIIQRMQEAARAGASPVEVALLLGQLCEAGLQQGTMTMYFKRAFPCAPLRTLLDAGAWRRVSSGGMSDDEFNAMLYQYLLAGESESR